MKLESYWLATAPPFKGGATGPVSGRTDVAIIGAGLTGLSATLALARKGAQVIVFEADQVGSSASGRNGGMCNNGLAGDFISVAKRLGLPTASALYLAYNTAVDTVEKLISEEGIDCDFKRTGKLKLAYKPAHYDHLAEIHEALAKANCDETILVPRSMIRTEIGSDFYYGGIVYPKSAGMHVGKFVRGLAHAAVRRGVQIYEKTQVTKLKRLGGFRHEVKTPKGTIVADKVLLATGSTTGGQFGHFRRRIVPVGSFIVVTEPLRREVLDDIMPTRRMATDSKNVNYYFRITPDDRLLFGGRAQFAMSSPRSDTRSGNILEKAMVTVFPQLRGTRLDWCWGGLVDMTRDRLPRAGEQDGLFYSMGYSGHGTQMATYMGLQMADIMDGKAEANIWRDLPWPAIPGHFGPPWFLPFVGTYYRLRDVLY